MADSFTPQVVSWAASVIVKELSTADVSSKFRTREDATRTFSTRITSSGLTSLKVPELKSLWNDLKHREFVYENPHGYKTGQTGKFKKNDWVQHVQQYLVLPEASAALVPYPNNSPSASSSSDSGSNTASAAPQALPAPAIAVAGMPPNIAGRTGHNYPGSPADLQFLQFQQYLHGQPFGGMTPHNAFHSNPFGPSRFASANSGGAAAAAAAARASLSPGHPTTNATPSANRKRKTAPADSSSQMNSNNSGAPAMPATIPASAVAAAIGAAFAPATAAAPHAAMSPEEASKKMLEIQIWTELRQMGFPEEHKQECSDAVRRALEAGGAPPTSDSVMMEIITRIDNAQGENDIDEAEYARQMDQARLLSEQDKHNESQQLREQRAQEQEERILNATFGELSNPQKAEDCKLFFPESWLLRYEPSKALLTDVVNNRAKSDVKKSLIKLLNREKKALRWYDRGVPKAFFTSVVGQRLLNVGGVDAAALKKEVEEIDALVERATSLPSEQNSDLVPNIFVEAQKEFTDQAPGESTCSGPAADDDSDDDIVVLDVRPARPAFEDAKPAAIVDIDG